MNKVKAMSLAAGVALAIGSSAALNAASAADGEAVFKKCQACHALEEGKNKVGPYLTGVVGRAAGAADGYRYSNINQAAGEAGLVWTKENIVAYLEDPQKFLESYLEEKGADAPGRTKMAFKLRSEEERMAVVEYLASQ